MTLNRMCLNCKCLDNDCAGTNCQDWTGCIYRKASDEKDLCSNQPIISREVMEEHNVLISALARTVNA